MDVWSLKAQNFLYHGDVRTAVYVDGCPANKQDIFMIMMVVYFGFNPLSCRTQRRDLENDAIGRLCSSGKQN